MKIVSPSRSIRMSTRDPAEAELADEQQHEAEQGECRGRDEQESVPAVSIEMLV